MTSARVVSAPDSFKGSATAADAARSLAAGWLDVRPADSTTLLPMADGGEGTLDAFEAAIPGAVRMPVRVTGPHSRDADASWLLLPGRIGVVELASTSGIEMLADDLRPWDADTTGLGQAIVAALDHGVERLLVGIGSSASTDAGMGLLRALGARVTNARGAPTPAGARGLAEASRVDFSGLRALPPGGVLVLSDVTNPLIGPRGAAAVFGPQKSFTRNEIDHADQGLAHIAALVPDADPDTPGAGAAGGAGFGLLAWGATLAPGAAAVAEAVSLADAVAAASVVITGEGSFDGQTAQGKAPAFVMTAAADRGVPVLLAAGRIAPEADASACAATASLTALAGSSQAALAEPARWLRAAGAVLAREWTQGSQAMGSTQ